MNIKEVIAPLLAFLNDARLAEILILHNENPLNFEAISEEQLNSIRTKLLGLLMAEEKKDSTEGAQQETSEAYNPALADTLYRVLIDLAKVSPINKVELISGDPILEANQVVVSSGHQFDLESLLKFHSTRPYRGNIYETPDEKWLINIITNAPFSLRDVRHIQAVAGARNLTITPQIKLRDDRSSPAYPVSLLAGMRNSSSTIPLSHNGEINISNRYPASRGGLPDTSFLSPLGQGSNASLYTEGYALENLATIFTTAVTELMRRIQSPPREPYSTHDYQELAGSSNISLSPVARMASTSNRTLSHPSSPGEGGESTVRLRESVISRRLSHQTYSDVLPPLSSRRARGSHTINFTEHSFIGATALTNQAGNSRTPLSSRRARGSHTEHLFISGFGIEPSTPNGFVFFSRQEEADELRQLITKLRTFNNILTRNPDDIAARLARARLITAILRRKPDEKLGEQNALSDYNYVLERHPNHVHALLGRAAIYRSNVTPGLVDDENETRALADYVHVLEIEPGNELAVEVIERACSPSSSSHWASMP